MTSIICYDLVPDIIKYVPLSALRNLCKASPMFTREIFKSGSRVLYIKSANISMGLVGKNKDIIVISGPHGTFPIFPLGDIDIYDAYRTYYDWSAKKSRYMFIFETLWDSHRTVRIKNIEHYMGQITEIFLDGQKRYVTVELENMVSTTIAAGNYRTIYRDGSFI